jgi:hypothetical protein
MFIIIITIRHVLDSGHVGKNRALCSPLQRVYRRRRRRRRRTSVSNAALGGVVVPPSELYLAELGTFDKSLVHCDLVAHLDPHVGETGGDADDLSSTRCSRHNRCCCCVVVFFIFVFVVVIVAFGVVPPTSPCSRLHRDATAPFTTPFATPFLFLTLLSVAPARRPTRFVLK